MIIDTTPTETSAAAGLNAVDLATDPATPITAYCRGWEDACYQSIYYNPHELDTRLWHEYDAGHADGMKMAMLDYLTAIERSIQDGMTT